MHGYRNILIVVIALISESRANTPPNTSLMQYKISHPLGIAKEQIVLNLLTMV